MFSLSKWLRQIHRWLVVPFGVAVIVMMMGSFSQGESFQTPGWVSLILIGSILFFFLTGLYMFAQPYWARWQRFRRSARELALK